MPELEKQNQQNLCFSATTDDEGEVKKAFLKKGNKKEEINKRMMKAKHMFV